MAEEFLESIYQEAKLLCELKQMVEWSRVSDEQHLVLAGNTVMPKVGQLCQRYVEQDKEKGMQLWEAAQSVTKVKGDMLLTGDIIEHQVIPLLEESMRQWGNIQIEDEEGIFRFESTVSGFLTLKNMKRNIYYHSTVDPMWEACKRAEYIYDPKNDAYSILGCGLGYLAYQLYLISQGSIVIHVFERDAKMVEYAKCYGVLDWIPEENLDIVIDSDILSFLHSAEQENMGFYMFLPELQEQPEDERFVLQELYAEYSVDKKFKRYVDINFYRNIKSDSKPVAEFDITQLKKDFIVVAAGPSLDDSMDFLRENQGKKTLIAVGTVFKKLIENNIIPDLVVVLDPQARTCKQIEGVEEQKVPMLIAISAYWGFAKAYQGEKYLVPIAQSKEILDYAKENKLDLWGCGGTVTSLAIEAAIRFGAERIYLVGADLAYPNGISHATGTMDRCKKSMDNMIPVEGVGNQTVYTTRVFIIYREWIEERIAETPNINYYNMSSIGAKIHGAEELRIQTNNAEILQNESEMGIEVDKIIDEMRIYEAEQFSQQLKRLSLAASKLTVPDWENLWNKISELENDRVKLVVWVECLKHIGNSKLYEEYLMLLMETNCLNWAEKYYMLWQIEGKIFGTVDIENHSITKLLYQNYHIVLHSFLSNLNCLCKIDERNSDLVFVTVQQFRNLNHAPTKTTLDRARVLKTKLGKKVMIINTAESFGGQAVEMISALKASYETKLLETETIQYEDESYPFFQFEQNMPNLNAAQEFFDFIKKYKPSYIVNIGGNSLLMDACNQIVPVLNINTVPSSVAKTEACMQVMGRELTHEAEDLLSILGKCKDDVIMGRFTWSLKPQTHQYTKEELEMPQNSFILAVIGGRLTTEISDKFIQMIDGVLVAGATLVIIGGRETYDEVCNRDAGFKAHTINLGMQEDVLAILDQCDLYVNPERKGGGTSVIEAMYKGCPAVTLRYGDVAVGAGEEFCVDNYEEMKNQIMRYMSDTQFYSEMSEKAKQRAEYMLDSDTAFVEIISEFEKRIKDMEI